MSNEESVSVQTDLSSLLNDILDNLPEYSVSFVVTKWDYSKREYTLVDKETDKEYQLNWENAMNGLKYVRKQLRNRKIFSQGLEITMAPNEGYNDSGNWDALDVDMVLQAAVLGEIIYG